MEIGAQLFTVTQYTQTIEDFKRTIKKIAEIGYKNVQLSVIGKDITPEIAKEVCDKYDLKIVLTHSPGERIMFDTEKLIDEHKYMGCKYIGLGAMWEKYRNEWWIENFINDYKKPAQMIKDAGLKFMYHNHNFEFQKIGGKYLLDYLLEGFDVDEMGITLDTYWVQDAGVDVCKLINKLNGRLQCVHLKDKAMLKHTPIMAPIYEGNMDFDAILTALKNNGCEYALVEQDVCQENPFVCLEKSYKNLTRKLK